MKIEKLLYLRKKNKLTQKDISRLLNVSVSQYQRYEYGINDLPTDLLIKIAKYYRVSIDYLLNYSLFKIDVDFLESRLKELDLKEKEELLTRLIKCIIEECK